jgi:kynurenine formamidase
MQISEMRVSEAIGRTLVGRGVDRWLAEESSIVGVGVETVGIDAGAAAGFNPPFPLHYYLLGAGKYGVTQLASLASLPPTGALFVVAPLKLTGGTGSPVRALALVPRG